MTKEALNKKIKIEIRKAMDASEFDDNQIRYKCNEFGVVYSQGRFSRYTSPLNNDPMPVALAVALCNVLNIDMNSLFSGNQIENLLPQVSPPEDINGAEIPKELLDNLLSKQNYIYDTATDICHYNCIEGDWYLCFISTHPDEPDKILHGKMTVSYSKSDYCNAHISLDTNRGFEKQYSGIIFGSHSTKSWYAFLKANIKNEFSIAEFCSLTFQNIAFNQKNDCMLSLCLTSAAGPERLPTVHRVLFTRNKIEDERILRKIHSSLLMNTSEIIVKEDDLNTIRNELKNTKNKKLLDFYESLISSSEDRETVIKFDDIILLKQAKKKHGEDFEKLVANELLTVLRRYSAEDKYILRFGKINKVARTVVRGILKEAGLLDLP